MEKADDLVIFIALGMSMYIITHLLLFFIAVQATFSVLV
jgi:hypothetical protein